MVKLLFIVKCLKLYQILPEDNVYIGDFDEGLKMFKKRHDPKKGKK